MTLVYVEHQAGVPDEASLQAIAVARQLAGGGAVHAMAAGPGAPDAAAALGGHGVATVHVAEHDALATHAPAALGRSLTELAGRLSSPAIVGPGTERGNEVLAHAAAIGDLPLAANCIAVAPGDELTVTRIRWGGSLLEEARVSGPVKLLTVAPHTVEAEDTGGGPAAVEPFAPALQDADLIARVTEQRDAGRRRRRVAGRRRGSSSAAAAAPDRPRGSRRPRSWRRCWAAPSAARAR